MITVYSGVGSALPDEKARIRRTLWFKFIGIERIVIQGPTLEQVIQINYHPASVYDWLEQTKAVRVPEAARFRLTGIDLFAGAGGFSLAASVADIHITAAVELDRHACETYRSNFETGEGGTRLFEADAVSVSAKDLLEASGLTVGECSIVMGGPPCQGFSSHRLNDAGVGDDRNNLLLRYFELVADIRPKVFLVENVPGLLWPRHQAYVRRFYELASAAGYRTFQPTVLNACDFGTPQNRKRVFILAVREDLKLDIEWPPNPTHGHPNSPGVLEGRLKPWVTARTVFASAVSHDPNDVHMNHSAELVAVFQSTPKDGGSRHESSRQLPCHAGHNGHADVYGRIALDVPGPTMTTACINPSKGRFVHPLEDHGITLRQAARFQTFPDDFVFKGGLMAGGKQIGNAVPVALGSAILSVVAIALLKDS